MHWNTNYHVDSVSVTLEPDSRVMHPNPAQAGAGFFRPTCGNAGRESAGCPQDQC